MSDGRTVHEVDRTNECKDPETSREITLVEHAYAMFNNGVVEDLCQAILLRRIWSSLFVDDTAGL